MATLSYRPASRHGRESSAARCLPRLECLCDDDAPAHAGGPGWFDSTWDLAHGLEVRELDVISAPLAIAFAARNRSVQLAA